MVKVELEKLGKVTLLIATLNSVYEVKLKGSDGSATLVGGTTATGQSRFPEPIQVFLVGCRANKGCLLKGQGFEFICDNDGKMKHICTSQLVSCKITAPDNSWSYEVWEEILEDNCSHEDRKEEAKAKKKHKK